jgi:hypothetical protein
VLVVVGFSKALVPRCTNDKAVGIGHVLYVCIQMGGKVNKIVWDYRWYSN